MAERVKMLNWITGTVMDVPADLVEWFKEQGHRVADAPVSEPEPEKKPTRKRSTKK